MTQPEITTVDEAVVLHAAGRHCEAEGVRSQRIDGAAPTDPRLPGYLAARALNLERQGDHIAAGEHARDALYLARPTSDDDDEARHLRTWELPSVRINAGTVVLRAAARQRLAGQHSSAISTHAYADNLLDLAYMDIQRQHTGTLWPHQHTVNILHRLSLKESVNGNTGLAMKYALGAIAVAPLSETPGLAEHTSGLGLKGQAVAKAKTLVRGFVALGAATTTLPGIRRRASAVRLRDRLILAKSVGA